MGDSLTADQEKRVKRLKRVVEGWRVVLLQTRSVLLWERPWHPALIVGLLTLAYLLLWLLDPNSLTLLASVGILLNLVDLVVPLVTAQLVPAWSGAQEKQLDELCRQAVLAGSVLESQLAAFRLMRNTKPLVYYAISITGLLGLLWLGRAVDNGRLLFLCLTALCLAPGALARGLPCKLQAAVRGIGATKKEI